MRIAPSRQDALDLGRGRAFGQATGPSRVEFPAKSLATQSTSSALRSVVSFRHNADSSWTAANGRTAGSRFHANLTCRTNDGAQVGLRPQLAALPGGPLEALRSDAVTSPKRGRSLREGNKGQYRSHYRSGPDFSRASRAV